MNESDPMPPFYLDNWYVDTVSNRLCQGETEVKLESKVMAVLNYLALHQNELVTREALEQAIWGKTVVGYDALTRCIAQLRKALNDDSREPRYIETISKKGYRLIAPVTSQGNSADMPVESSNNSLKTRQHIWTAGFALILLAVILLGIFQLQETNQTTTESTRNHDLPSIVVLPFTNLDDVPEQRYFSDGVTADITTALSKLSGLLVISQSSAMGYQSTSTDIKQSAESLGVRYVLEGSVRRTDERIRVNVNLIDNTSDIYLWSEKYDRELRSVFDVQDDITNNIIHALSIKLTEEEKRRTAHQYTASIDAYDDFLRGQAHYFRYTQEDNRSARNYFQQAIDRDESFARAYSAMALTYVAEHRYAWGEPSIQQLDEALRLANKGKSLDDELPQAHWVLAYVQLFRREFASATEAASRAVALDPNYADGYLTLAFCKLHDGMPRAAVSLVRKAILLNPQYPAAYASILGQSYFFTGQYERAIPVLREAIDRNNNLLTAHVFLIAALSKLDQIDEAKWAAEQLKSTAADFSASQVGEMLAFQNDSSIEEVKKHLQRAGL